VKPNRQVLDEYRGANDKSAPGPPPFHFFLWRIANAGLQIGGPGCQRCRPIENRRDQPLLQARKSGWGGGSLADHDLTARLMQGIEGVEELLLVYSLPSMNWMVIDSGSDSPPGSGSRISWHAVLADRLGIQVVGEDLGGRRKTTAGVGIDLDA